MPDYLGTLAAVRCLGARGSAVTVAGSHLLSPARWSRHASRAITCPSPRDWRAFIEWLLRYGEENPGTFLYPTSDDIVWLFARHEAELRARFLLFQPPAQTLYALLDKRRLHAACARAGVDTVPSWLPQSEAELLALAPQLPYPILLKPVTQAMLRSLHKGSLAWSATELAESFRARLAADRYPPDMEEVLGPLSAPILQRFCESAEGGIHSLSGFVDREGALLGARASIKVLQRPKRIGIGLCFESTPVDPRLADAAVRLCRELGYFGIFEAEFIVEGGRAMLIDFNPRFYGQMGFEDARGLPLALFAMLGAMGDEAGLRALAQESERAASHETSIYCHRFFFELILGLRSAAGSLTAEERRRWHAWHRAHRERAFDASASLADPLPGLVHATAELWSAARHPRAFLRGLRDA